MSTWSFIILAGLVGYTVWKVEVFLDEWADWKAEEAERDMQAYNDYDVERTRQTWEDLR